MSVTAPTLPPPISADPTVDFVGLFADQTEDVILNRMEEWANEGLDPVEDADLWTDTREGGHWYMAVMPCVRELARLYDVAGTEVPMSAMMLWAWGSYLDDLAAAGGVERLAATPAVGMVTFDGPVGTEINQGTTLSTIPKGPDDDTPDFEVTQEGTIGVAGTMDLPIEATEGGEAGNVAVDAITVPSTPLPAGVTFSNSAATEGGTDPESDEALRKRVLQAIAGTAGANQAAYEKWAAAWPGVGAVKVVPTWNGPNTVLVLITDPSGQPLPAQTVTDLQNDLDPVAGKGAGAAPVGAQVTVHTSVAHAIAVDAAGVVFEEGYSADGAGGTIAVSSDISSAVQDYMLTVAPGDSVRHSHVQGIVATWEGVVDAPNVTLNGAAADVALALDPPESAQLTGNAVTFT